MTEWNADEYLRHSQLQVAMADEVLTLLDLAGLENVLDVGCGDGRITARIAAGVPRGSVVGIDPSREMIASASSRFPRDGHPNLRFDVADARRLPFRAEFDMVVSFNALHWVPEQDAALRGIRSALKSAGRAQLRLVPAGERKSLEEVVEETRLSAKWAGHFEGFRDPYLRLRPEQYAAVAERNALRVLRIHSESKAWKFESRDAFFAFCSVGLVEWTRRLPEDANRDFVGEVLDRYNGTVNAVPGEANTFKFYQMDVTLAAGPST